MSYLSSAVRGRQLVLLCARLLVQCVMAWSTPQAGMNELELKYAHTPDGSTSQSIARNGQQRVAVRSWMQLSLTNREYQ